MTTTLYMTRTGDMIITGKRSSVTLDEYPAISSTWVRRLTVELPDGFVVAEAVDGSHHIYRGNDYYELGANINDEPIIYDHTQHGKHIALRVVSEEGSN